MDLKVLVINCCHYAELIAAGPAASASVRATSCSEDILGASKNGIAQLRSKHHGTLGTVTYNLHNATFIERN